VWLFFRSRQFAAHHHQALRMSPYFPLLMTLVVAYLLGSVSGSLFLGRRRGVDIRTQGSGNAGGTNAFRTMGWRFALGVVLIDMGKGALAAGVAVWAQTRWGGNSAIALDWAWLAALLAAVGHTWPVYHGFRGGKGAGTLIGALCVIWPTALMPCLIVWLLVLTMTGFVGLSTVLAAGILPVLAWVRGDAPLWFALVALGFILFTHRSNLLRLARGNEHRFARVRIWHHAWRYLQGH